MPKKMLIDASHTEEKRVAILDQNRLDEYDVETLTKKQNKGNVYLAKVVRIEPSLQAAFVEYGGSRHGFLAFDEIHPDYYQIPIDDREKLKREMMELRKASQKEEDEEESESENADISTTEAALEAVDQDDEDAGALDAEIQSDAEETSSSTPVEVVSDDEEEDEFEKISIHSSLLRRYKIQEVIRRGQVILIQVVKEERGNKGAALTSYLSLAGRYCVLMPNNERGGGVSRKINVKDRKRLKQTVSALEVPDGMSVIIRTAGKDRTKKEIAKDYEYLMKTWTSIRERTLNSIAPALIYEEGDLIKRALRDMYSQDIDEILVQGEEDFKDIKTFVRLLMPAVAKKLKQYKDDKVSLFQKYQIENQLEALHNPTAHLKSGGYLVINQTEALVAIDVNSGRATKERNIEETALKTNLEAAEEVARQLRLRDLAGLIVIDFIDMEEMRNNHVVERAVKEALRRDRARVQVGRISGFGLLELSRQRLQSSFIETNYLTCPYCKGRGVLRSVASAALHSLRILEEESHRSSGQLSKLNIFLPTKVALYTLNHLREDILRLETAHQFKISISSDDSIQDISGYRLERIRNKQQQPQGQGQSSQRPQDLPTEDIGEEPIPSESSKKNDSRKQNAEDGRSQQQPRNHQKHGSGLFGSKRKNGKNKNNSNSDNGRKQPQERDAPAPKAGKAEILYDSHNGKPENRVPAVKNERPASTPALKEDKSDVQNTEPKTPKKGWWRRKEG